MDLVFQRRLLQLFLLVPSDLRPPGALRVPRHPQHPPLLRHQEGRETQAEAAGQQSEGRAGGDYEGVSYTPNTGNDTHYYYYHY